MILLTEWCKGAYIKYVAEGGGGEGAEGFTKFFKKIW